MTDEDIHAFLLSYSSAGKYGSVRAWTDAKRFCVRFPEATRQEVERAARLSALDFKRTKTRQRHVAVWLEYYDRYYRPHSTQVCCQCADSYTLSALSDALGCQVATVQHWLAEGKLAPTRCVQSPQAWHITDHAVRTFLEAHPGEINLARINKDWFFRLAFGTH